LELSNTKEPFYNVEINRFGTIFYYDEDGKFHNLNGPAIEYVDGSKAYYVDGNLHRIDGPAVIYSDGEVEYWLNGKKLTKEEFDKLTK